MNATTETNTSDQPEHAIVSPELESVHRRGDDFQPACIARLHHLNKGTEFRLTELKRTDDENYCQHPECFGGEN